MTDDAPAPRGPDALATSMDAMLGRVIEAVPAGVIVTDHHGTIVLVNAEAERLFGYPRSEMVGRSIEVLVPEAARAAHRELRAGYERSPHVRTMSGMMELHGRCKDGSEIPLEIGLSPVETPAGLMVVASVVDLTLRLETERALRTSERRLRHLTESMSEVFFSTRADLSEVLYVNPAYERVWGRSVESLYQDPSSFLDGVLEEDRSAVLGGIERIQRGLPPSDAQFRVVRPDGTVRWVTSHTMPYVDPESGTHNINGIVRDITEERLARAQLEDSLERFRKLAEATSDGIIVSVNGKVHDVSDGFLRMFGYDSLDEIRGRPVLDFATDEARESVAHHVADQIEGTYEFEGRRRDGSTIIVEVNARTHVIDGAPARISALRDLTERRRLEARLRQAQSLEAIGRLAGGVAHDFNNLLTVILGAAEFLLQDLRPGDPRREDAESIYRAAASGTEVTRQLLAFGRRQILQPRLISVNDVIRGVQGVLHRMIGEHYELLMRLTDEPAQVLVDPGQVERILFNLVLNARDAMPDGGSVVVETRVQTLGSEYTRRHVPMRPGPYVMIAVSDSGVGMDRETREQVFEPFFTTKPEGRGTGLGLATVYGTVKQSGGFIWVYSEPDRGTTIKIYLPRAGVEQASQESLDETERAALPRPGRETVLVVEDNEAVRRVAERALAQQGYAVICAADGNQALAVLDAGGRAIDLVVTDMRMPGLGGRALADRIAASHPRIKVLFMSGYTDDSVVRHGLTRGTASSAFLQKPFSAAEIAAAVRQLLDRAR